MATLSANVNVPTLAVKPVSEQHRIVRQFLKRKIAVIGLVIIVIELLVIGLGPFFVGYDPEEAVMVDRFLPPS